MMQFRETDGTVSVRDITPSLLVKILGLDTHQQQSRLLFQRVWSLTKLNLNSGHGSVIHAKSNLYYLSWCASLGWTQTILPHQRGLGLVIVSKAITVQEIRNMSY